MIDIEQLKREAPGVYSDICKRLQNDQESRTSEELEAEMSGMSPGDLLDAFLEWNGIIGYSRIIWDAVHSITRAAGE